MREDMFKVIVERPRGGAGRGVRSRKRLNRDGDLPTKIGVSRLMWLTRAKSKWLSENLGPLKRYFGKQVGRSWNDIHSDIHATLSSSDPVQQHIFQHIDCYVARDLTLDRQGQWINPRRHALDRSKPLWWQPYFVDPVDGRLKDSVAHWKRLGIDPKPWRRKAESDPDVRILDKATELRCIEGVWYELIFLHDRTQPAKDGWVFDLLTRTKVRPNTRHAIAKRQLSRDELLAHGIANRNN